MPFSPNVRIPDARVQVVLHEKVLGADMWGRFSVAGHPNCSISMDVTKRTLVGSVPNSPIANSYQINSQVRTRTQNHTQSIEFELGRRTIGFCRESTFE